MPHTLKDLVEAYKEEFGETMPAQPRKKTIAPIGFSPETAAALRQELIKARASKVLGERSIHESIQR